jgi:hypothetical protein
MKSNHIDEYVSSGTSPTVRLKVSKRSGIVASRQTPIDLSELAERLNVSERWVYGISRRRCPNPLPVIRIGRYLRFDWLEVSAWLRRQSGRAA